MGVRTPVILSSVVLVGVLATSCGGHPEDRTAVRASDRSATEQPAATRSPGPSPERSGADRPRQEHRGRYDLVLEDATVVPHRERDRVVLRFSGTGRPGWAARFVDEAVLDGSGKVVELDGDAILRLDISGTPTTTRRGGAPVPSELGGDVVDLRTVGAYEGVTQVFIGLRDGRRPFRVFALTAPSRLVVDIGRRASAR